MKPTDKELRELDAWIAEKMFGRKWYLFDGHICQLEEPSKWQARKWQARYGGQEVDYPRPDDERDITGVPHYTTDPAAAMQVLEKILQTMGSMPVITTAGKKFVWANPKKHEPYHDADTLYLAIALFAKELFSK